MFQERCVIEKNSFRNDTYILATSKDLWPTVVPRQRGSLVVPLKGKQSLNMALQSSSLHFQNSFVNEQNLL